jgi:3-oxoacyl-[acyl-carrier-protein] synthase I
VEEKMESALAMKDVWIVSDTILSPLGNSSEENFSNAVKSISGLKKISIPSIASSIPAGYMPELIADTEFTRFERMCSEVIDRLHAGRILSFERTLFVLSTTKGNVDLLKTDSQHPRIHLHAAAKHIAAKFGFRNTIVVSNACVSGVMAITVAKRYLQRGGYDHAIVVGADELTEFVVSGFQCLGALSTDFCKPFDRNRTGINLGEAAAGILLTVFPENFADTKSIKVLGSGLTNDANHISGPSRTGEELAQAIGQAIHESEIDVSEIDFVSAHGTATLYNDEMEAKAFNRAGLNKTPLNSLKGFYGHTLGAAGVVETVMSIRSLQDDTLIPSLGFETLGVSQDLNIIRKPEFKKLTAFLKTASGFGGCNAALILKKF